VAQALAHGHTIHAGFRGTETPAAPGLTAMACDATNIQDVRQLIAGCDAVVSVIGHIKGSPPRVQTEAMHALCAAMEQEGVRRLVSLTGTGVRQPGDTIPLADRLLNLLVSIVDPARVRDGRDHVAVLEASDLEWTVVRVLKLQQRSSGPVVLSAHGPTRLFVSRDAVATAILDVLEAHSFIRQMPILSRS